MGWIFKRLALAMAVLLGLAAVGAAGVYALSSLHLHRVYDRSGASLTIPRDAATAAEGQRLYVTMGCGDCHGADAGGHLMVDDPLAGVLAGPNLTTGRGGVGGLLSDEAYELAIRHGIGRDGRALVYMPSGDYHPMADRDVAAIVAYLRSVPPVDREPPHTAPGPLLRTLYLLGQVPLLHAELIRHDSPSVAIMLPGATAEYGRYLARMQCAGCHGEGFSGGAVPGAPPSFAKAGNITPDVVSGIGAWNLADFERAMRQGVRPDGSRIDPFMPWQNYVRMTDTEMQAVYAYLRTVPARPRGQR